MGAIPWVGQDIVELLWGGLNKLLLLMIEEPYDNDVILQILLIAGTFTNLEVIYDCIFLFTNSYIVNLFNLFIFYIWIRYRVKY